MAISGADVKVGFDIFLKLFKIFKQKANSRKEKVIIDNIYKELLMGGKSDLVKIESLLMQLEKYGSTNPEYIRANNLYNNALIATIDKISAIKSKSFGEITVRKCVKGSSGTIKMKAAKKFVKPKSRAIIKKKVTKSKGVKK